MFMIFEFWIIINFCAPALNIARFFRNFFLLIWRNLKYECPILKSQAPILKYAEILNLK